MSGESPGTWTSSDEGGEVGLGTHLEVAQVPGRPWDGCSGRDLGAEGGDRTPSRVWTSGGGMLLHVRAWASGLTVQTLGCGACSSRCRGPGHPSLQRLSTDEAPQRSPGKWEGSPECGGHRGSCAERGSRRERVAAGL